MKALTRTKLWFALFVVVVFGSGVGTGLLVARFGPPGPWSGRHGPPGPPPSPADSAARIAHDLELTPEQEREIRAAFERGAVRLNEFRSRTGQEFDALLNELNTDIEKSLRPEQREQFRAHLPRRRRDLPPPPRD
jgi:Spy/CpxP family protein refolding chaperone